MKLDLENAFKSILRDDRRGNNPTPDPLRFSYVTLDKKLIFKEIKEKIKNGKYSVEPLLMIDVPKSNFTIRPMARPEITDWIAYQAVINYLVPKIIRKTSRRSYSMLNFRDPRRRRVNAWKKFDDKSRDLYKSGNLYVVITDISGYFENIDLRELRKKLINYIDKRDKNTTEVIDFLHNKILLPWSSRRVENFGLPQGPTASSFLGDIYLDNFDREMESEPSYFRYMDDIRVFCKSEIKAKKALIKIVKSLRKYKLNINAKKTRILRNLEIEKELFDPKKAILDSIQEALESQEFSKIQAIKSILLKDIFKGGFSDKNPFQRRHLNFGIFRLSILKSSGIDFNEKIAIDLILDNFTKKPHHSKDFCSFLTLFPRSQRIKEFLIKFLFSKDNIYEWQELHVLRALLKMKITVNRNLLKKLSRRFLDKNRNWAVRSLYCLLVGQYGRNTDRELLIDEFNSAEKNEIRKSIALAVQELGLASRNDFYRSVRKRIWPKSFVNYIKNLQKAMYFRPYDRIKIETLGEEKFEIIYSYRVR
ncbi:MAG: reverse transcriptase domain-containing protein [Candidatus Nealsonbacteria bacterium]